MPDTEAPVADPEVASSADSATSLDNLPFPGEVTSGEGEEQQPAAEGSEEEQPEEAKPDEAKLPFDDETELGAFLDLYADKLIEHPKVGERLSRVVQSRVDQAVARQMAAPESDERYLEERQAEDEKLAALAEHLRNVEGGGDADTRQIARQSLAVRDAAARKELVAAQWAAQVALGTVTTELNQAAGRDLFSPDMRQAYMQAEKLFNRMYRAQDEPTRQRAFPEYMRRALELTRDAAIAFGREVERAHQERQAKARETLQRSNLQRETVAKTAARTPPVPQQAAQARPVLTRDALTSGSWQDLQKLLRDAGEKI